MKKTIVCSVAALLLAGCNGEGGSGGVPESRPSGSVSGVAFDGLITNGDVKVYAWDGEQGELLGEGRTDSAGEYSVTLDQVPSQPVLIEIGSGRYVEEASGRSVSLRDGDELYALAFYEQGNSLSTSITYFTTIAAGMAEYLVSTGRDESAAIDQANKAVDDLLGIDIQSVTPLEVVDSRNATPVVTDGHLYGFATSSISQLTKWVSEQNDSDIHEEYNSLRFAQAAYQDIRADGLLDGKGDSGVIALGVVRLTPEIYRHGVATNMLVMANSERNVTGLGPKDVFPVAERMNTSNSSMFAGEDIIPLKENRPEIVNLSHASQELVAGSVSVSAEVVDSVGLDDVSFYVDGVLQESIGAEASPTFLFDTRSLIDGPAVFEIRAVNIAGGSASHQVEVVVANSSTEISAVQPADGEYVSGTFPFSAKVTDPIGVNSIRFIMTDGATYTLPVSESVVKEFDTSTFSPGPNSFTIEVTNSSSQVVSRKVDFHVDNEAPSVSWDVTEDQHLEPQTTINASIDDNIGVQKWELFSNGDLLDEGLDKDIAINVGDLSLADGVKNLVLRVTDNAGNTNSVSESTFVDSTPPSIKSFEISRSGSNRYTFNYSLSYAENVGISTIDLYLDGTRFERLTPNELSGVISGSLDFEGVPNGERDLKVVVSDRGGYQDNQTESITINHNKPELQLVKANFNTETYDSGQYTQYYHDVDVEVKIENYTSGVDYRIHSAVIFRHDYDPATRRAETNQFRFSGDTITLNEECGGIFAPNGVMKIRVADSYGNVSDELTLSTEGTNSYTWLCTPYAD